jgi:acyl-CoA dehydrogenase
MLSLDAERATIQDGQLSDPHHLQAVLAAAQRAGRTDELVTRQALADLWIRDRAAEWLGQWIGRTGSPPGPELALTKLALGANHRRRAAALSEVLGVGLTADDGWKAGWATFTLSVPAITIAGGTDEILRTMVAERVLGLAKEPPVS